MNFSGGEPTLSEDLTREAVMRAMLCAASGEVRDAAVKPSIKIGGNFECRAGGRQVLTVVVGEERGDGTLDVLAYIQRSFRPWTEVPS